MTITQNFDALNFRFTPRAEYMDDESCAKASALFDDGHSKAEAAETLGVNASVAHLAAQIAWHGRIPFTSQDELAKAVVEARDEAKQGWASIGARAGGLSEARVQRLYEQGSGGSYVESRLAKSTRQRTEPRKPAEQKAPAITEAELKGMTVKALRAHADEQMLEVPAKARKSDLVALIVAGQQ